VHTNWATHDFTVKMLDWSAARGSRLAYTCRRCGRRFCHFSLLSRDSWAIDREGRSLDTVVTNRWLTEECPRLFNVKDDEDRKQLSKSGAHA
jgi:hypothetical protein